MKMKEGWRCGSGKWWSIVKMNFKELLSAHFFREDFIFEFFGGILPFNGFFKPFVISF